MSHTATKQALTSDAQHHQQLLGMINGFWISQMVHVAADLGLADLIQQRVNSVTDLAARTQTDSASLYRLLRALASQGLFQETEPEQFTLTPMASLLCTDHADSLNGIALYSGDPRQLRYQSWGELKRCIETGQPAFPRLAGMKPFAYLSQHPELAQVFAEAMAGYTAQSAEAILAHYDFSQYQHVIDVGGGSGSLLQSILQRYPNLSGTVFDLPEVVSEAETRLAIAGLQARASAVAGSFFDSLPDHGDLYILKCILHDWSDQQVVSILQCCRRAIHTNNRLLIADAVILPGNLPCPGKLMDLNMMVIHGGKERTESEFLKLLSQAGFGLTRTIITGSSVDLIEAQAI